MKIGITALALALVVCGCASDPERDAPHGSGEVLRFHNWWNYYERGLARMADGQSAAAREDFERCLELRPGARFGNPDDAWRVRTYGVHMRDGYFPNRELGVAWYLEGQPDRAVPLLEKSLRQAPSGRARHYLNLARREQLARAKPASPRIDIDPASRVAWTRERTREVAGTARADALVRGLAVDGRPVFIELAEASRAFREPVTLREGRNAVRVAAQDLLGRETVETLEWRADWRPPALVITRAEPDGAGWVVEGYATDDQEIAGVTVAGQELPIANDPRRVPVRVAVAAGGRVAVEVTDRAGNRLRSEVSAGELAREWAAAEGWRVAAAGTETPAPASSEADGKKPNLTLSVAPDEAVVVYHEQYFLDGVARDRGGLKELTVLGEPQLDAAQRGCMEKHFSTVIDLEPGTNVVVVAARDLAGNVASRQVVIVRRTAEYLDEEYRLTATLPPLACPGAEVHAVKAHHLLSGQIRNRPVRFRLLERNEGWDAVLREQQLSASALADPSVQLRVGKLLPAELVFLGAVLQEGPGVTLRIQVVESGQGEVLFAEDVYTEEPARELAYQAQGLVLKIKQRLPLVDGQVVRISGGRAVVNVGAIRGVSSASRFVVAEPGAAGAPRESARVVREGGRFVQLAVADLEAESTVALVLPPEAAGRVKAGDLVFAR